MKTGLKPKNNNGRKIEVFPTARHGGQRPRNGETHRKFRSQLVGHLFPLSGCGQLSNLGHFCTWSVSGPFTILIRSYLTCNSSASCAVNILDRQQGLRKGGTTNPPTHTPTHIRRHSPGSLLATANQTKTLVFGHLWIPF